MDEFDLLPCDISPDFLRFLYLDAYRGIYLPGA